jgi:hypothetical protein
MDVESDGRVSLRCPRSRSISRQNRKCRQSRHAGSAGIVGYCHRRHVTGHRRQSSSSVKRQQRPLSSRDGSRATGLEQVMSRARTAGGGRLLPLPERTGPARLWSRRRRTPTAPCGGALRPALPAPPAGTALGWHQVVGGEFVAIATAGRRQGLVRRSFLSEQRDY